MPAVEVAHVNKSYGGNRAVIDLSFIVNPAEVLGLIGPNGAGKSTTIKMMLDIIKPDSGEITVFNQKISADVNNKLGYLPEERGLYRKLKVIDSILYLSSLKGLDSSTARQRADVLLTQTGLNASKNKKIEELSKGMSQIIQFIITIIHDPQLIIMDEPFVGLDPVNTEILKRVILDLRNQGKAIVLSTHQMNQVEELCDRVLMINKGRAVLYGDLQEIKYQYRNNAVLVSTSDKLGEISGVDEVRPHKSYYELILNNGVTPKQLLKQLVDRGIDVNRFEIATPSLNEIFLNVAGKAHE